MLYNAAHHNFLWDFLWASRWTKMASLPTQVWNRQYHIIFTRLFHERNRDIGLWSPISDITDHVDGHLPVRTGLWCQEMTWTDGLCQLSDMGKGQKNSKKFHMCLVSFVAMLLVVQADVALPWRPPPKAWTNCLPQILLGCWKIFTISYQACDRYCWLMNNMCLKPDGFQSRSGHQCIETPYSANMMPLMDWWSHRSS